MLGNIVLILLNGEEKGKAHLAMDKLIRLGSSLMGEPPVEAIKAYIDCCIQDNSPDIAIVSFSSIIIQNQFVRSK